MCTLHKPKLKEHFCAETLHIRHICNLRISPSCFFIPHYKTFTLCEHVPTKKSLDRQKPLLQPNLKIFMKKFHHKADRHSLLVRLDWSTWWCQRTEVSSITNWWKAPTLKLIENPALEILSNQTGSLLHWTCVIMLFVQSVFQGLVLSFWEHFKSCL